MGEWCLGVTLARHEDDDDDADCSDWQLALPSSSPAWEAKAKVPPSQQARLPVWPACLPCQAAGGGPPQKCHALVGMVLGDPSPSPPRRRRRSHPPPRRGPRTCARDSPLRPRESPLTHHSSGPRAHLPRPVRCACVSPASTTTTTILGRTAPCRAPNQTSPAQRPSQVGGPVCRTHPFQSRPSLPLSLRTNVRSTRRASTKGGKTSPTPCREIVRENVPPLPSPVLSCPVTSRQRNANSPPRASLGSPQVRTEPYTAFRHRKRRRRSIGQPASRPPTRQHARTHARHNLPKSTARTHSR